MDPKYNNLSVNIVLKWRETRRRGSLQACFSSLFTDETRFSYLFVYLFNLYLFIAVRCNVSVGFYILR